MQRYQVVTQNDIERIHETSLRIMEEVGVVFSYEPARNILAKGGAKVDGKTVRFPPEMVERNLKLIPSSFKLHARNPKKDVEINTRDTVYAGPEGPPFVLDLDKGRRSSTLEDFKNLAKLCQMLDNIGVQGQAYCEPNDVEVKMRHLELTYYALKYNEKPLMGSVLGYQDAKDCIEMMAIAHGGIDAIKARPVITSIPCSLTPLSYDDKMAGAIIAYAEYGQPQLVNSLSIAGATNLTTIAGAIALQNAEVLAGIVLAQLVNPGTPIMYGASGSNADMRTGSLC
ncbi:MAG: trimethylamine methyltransferase family protein, partial [Treponema sp.]|nr:trimethylamine methyltransferase family protein [Treponema sp.]